ncbi:MAG: hypothetical protein KatS3mg011_2289 [Acidimicrobiia bacterium]|nr:MAG: hypothetical protein KatS3mg011_2289 [Acidimicrobiia bacterium]
MKGTMERRASSRAGADKPISPCTTISPPRSPLAVSIPDRNLLSRLIDHQVNDLAAFVSLLLTAGGETTDKVLSNLWHNLLTNPEQLELVRAEPVLLDHAFAETMRFSPPLVYLGREVVEPIELHGVTIPAGAELRLGVGSANRDETVFTNPDRFDLTRTDLHKGLEHRSISYTDGAGHLSFGAGPHFCLGYALARLEVTVASRMLLERFPRLALAEDPPPIRVEGPSQSPGRLLVRV